MQNSAREMLTSIAVVIEHESDPHKFEAEVKMHMGVFLGKIYSALHGLRSPYD